MHCELCYCVINKGNYILFFLLTGIFLKNHCFCFCCRWCYCWCAPCDTFHGNCPGIQFAHPFGDLVECKYMSETTLIVRTNSGSTGSFHTDDRFASIHRYLWWVGRSVHFFPGFKVWQSFTDENTLIFIGTFTVSIIRGAVGGTGILVIVTSFVGASQSSARTATVSIVSVGLILFVSAQASGARCWCWWDRAVYNGGTSLKL